jgi:hypothetical protein
LIASDLCFFGGIQGHHDAAVFAEGIVHGFHKTVHVAILPVVESIAALVAAKLLVRSAPDAVAAFHTVFFY